MHSRTSRGRACGATFGRLSESWAQSTTARSSNENDSIRRDAYPRPSTTTGLRGDPTGPSNTVACLP